MRTIKRSTNVVKKMYEGLGTYLSPSNFTYMWSLGAASLLCLIIMIVTGLILSMFYKADINMAFTSVFYISTELSYGWLVRYIHMNGASLFFLMVYLHLLKNMWYGSYTYPRQALWLSGMIILFLMMATAFMGYVLPWGQMSIWGAIVITNIFSAIPVIGVDFVIWLWGGLSLDNATLSRFYSLHFFLPFVILALSMLHLIFLHEYGSNHSLGIISRTDNINFYLNYVIKDLYSWILLIVFFSFFVFFHADYFGDSDNYILGNFMVTPLLIVPEWYFLPLFGILRVIPSKLGGLIVLIIAFVFLILWPFLIGFFQTTRNSFFKPIYSVITFFFIINLLLIGWLGGQAVEPLYLFLGRFSLFLYFFFFFLLILFNIIDYYIILTHKLLTKA